MVMIVGKLEQIVEQVMMYYYIVVDIDDNLVEERADSKVVEAGTAAELELKAGMKKNQTDMGFVEGMDSEVLDIGCSTGFEAPADEIDAAAVVAVEDSPPDMEGLVAGYSVGMHSPDLGTARYSADCN